MHRTPALSRFYRQHGFVLITALIFLVVLTLIGVVATKNTTLGLKMSHNFQDKMMTFEGSETARVKVDDLLDAVTFNRGWPDSMGGTVTAVDFVQGFPNNAWPSGVTLLAANWTAASPNQASVSNPPWNITDGNPNGPATAAGFLTLTPMLAYQYGTSNTGAYADTGDINSYISVYKLGVANNPGSGAAMISGYEGTGKGAAGSGAAVFYYLRSQGMLGGLSPAPTGAVAYTGADYRAIVR